MNNIITQIFELCIIPLLGILTKYLVDYLNSKKKSELSCKYEVMITDTIITCIQATNQTYVDTLKKQGKFDKEAQKIAFEKTYDAIMIILNKEIKTYLQEVTGDIQLYITQQIEAQVKANKQ